MGIRVKNIPQSANKDDILVCLADYIALLPPNPAFPSPINFDFHLVKDNRGFGRSHAGFGFITLPDLSIEITILSRAPLRLPTLQGFPLNLDRGLKQDRTDVVRRLRETTFKDPRIAQEERRKEKDLQSPVDIVSVGWGLMCRDEVFSVEVERKLKGGQVVVDSEKKRIDISSSDDLPNIRIPLFTINPLTVDRDSDPPSIYLTLNLPPSFEKYPKPPEDDDDDPYSMRSILFDLVASLSSAPPIPTKHSFFDSEHARVAPYLNDIRLVFSSTSKLDDFLLKASKVHLTGSRLNHNSVPIARRDLYSADNLQLLNSWFKKLDITLAVQVDALLQNAYLDPTELLALSDSIERIAADASMGVEGAEQVLSRFGSDTWRLYAWENDEGEWEEAKSPMELFEEVTEEVSSARALEARTGGRDEREDPGLFRCFHVVHTPTSIFVQDRQPERTNRIVRKYLRYQDRFLRINFRSVETHLLFFPPPRTDLSSFS